MKRTLLTLFLLPALAFADSLGVDVMHFGAYSSNWGNQGFFTDSRLETMHLSLGFNQHMCGGFPDTTAGRFARHGVIPYPWGTKVSGGEEPDAQVLYAEAQYILCHPESSAFYNITFSTTGWIADDSSVYSDDGTLEELDFGHPNLFNRLGNPDSTHIEYYPSLRIMIDTTGSTGGDAVGIFKAYRHWRPGAGDTTHVFIDTIMLSDLADSLGNLPTGFVELQLKNEVLSDSAFFHALETVIDSGRAWIRYSYETQNSITSYIDYVKIHCQFGRDLVEENEFDTDIITSISRTAYEDTILGWFLKDTENVGNFRPQAYINMLIEDSSGWASPVYGPSWITPVGAYDAFAGTFRDFARIARPKVLWSYLYPIWIGTKYTGFDGQSPSGTSTTNGLQYDLWWNLVVPCDSIRTALEVAGERDGWIYTPQFWFCDVDYDGCASWEQRRKPTRAELRCLTYIGLCYHPTGILIWKYDTVWDHSNNIIGLTGITALDGNPVPGMYEAVRDDINPYLKAIDSTYLQLTWDVAYVIAPDSNIPSGAWISSISTWSHPDTANPDTGWYHVGQFTEGSDRYIMLVNRACSQGENDPTPAPSITATFKFDPTNLGLGNYVYIIDIATGTDSADWVGTPDTTYSAKLGGIIPFTTVLGPGEGRLFKIVGVSEYRPLDSIQTSWHYSGLLRPKGDITVDSAETLTIYGPAEFRFSCSDQTRGGVDTKRPELILDKYSQLFAYGRESDSVLFTFLNDFCPSVPSITDWYGIRLACGGDYYFDYCRISDVISGITVEFPNSFRLLHTNVRDFDKAGVSLYGTHYDSTFIDNCRFIKGDHGILSDYGSVDVDSCAIDSVDYYGIMLSKDASAPICDCSGYSPDTYVTLTSSANSIDHAGYGIAVLGQSGATPYPTLTSNGDNLTNIDNDGIRLSYASSSSVIKEEWAYRLPDNFTNLACGISLYASSPTITGGPGGPMCSTYFQIITADLGIDCQGGSNPSITRCSIFADTCVRADSNSLPNLHRRKNNLDGVSYEVYNNNSSTILAQSTWWDGGPTIYGPVDTSMAAEDPYCGPMPKREPEPLSELPVVYSLDQNYPNPFNAFTIIQYSLPEASVVIIDIYDILGRKVETLMHEKQPAGYHQITWNAEDASSGLYFYRIQAEEFIEIKKMLLLK